MTEKDYEPQEERTFIYKASLTVTDVFTGAVISDAPEEYTKEKLAEGFGSPPGNVEILEFREATPEEIEWLTSVIDETPPTIN